MKPLCERLRDAGATFTANGDKLSIRATRPLPVDLLTDLRACREDLIERYRERCAIREHDAGMPRAEAERLAACDVTAWLAEAGREGGAFGVLPPKRSLGTSYAVPATSSIGPARIPPDGEPAL